MFYLRAPNGLLMVESKAPDTLSGGCGWTDPVHQSRTPATFKDREDVRSRTEIAYPLIWKWYNDGSIQQQEAHSR